MNTLDQTAKSTIVDTTTETTSSPPEVVVQPSKTAFLAHEIRTSIQNQYLVAAEKGQISKIKAWRVVRGLDQMSLASKARMTQPEISRAERLGQANKMKGETLRRLANALQVRVDDLF